MSLTVKQLIAALRKMPMDAKVAVCDHDQDHERGEFNGTVSRVQEASEALKDRGLDVVIQL